MLMEKEIIKVRKTGKNEIAQILEFVQEDWNAPIREFFRIHSRADYFYPAVAKIKSEIIGFGMAVINDNAAWLGFISVKEEHRNKGAGKMITNHLIEYSKTRGAESIILIATEMGLRVYEKIGFEHDLYYLFFRSDKPFKIDFRCSNISRIEKDDYARIFNLDYEISGEKRERLLAHYLQSGFKYKDRKIKGYYLPDFGRGLIIADSEEAGLGLLKFSLSGNTSMLCVPETNMAAITFFNSLDLYQYLKASRMFLNKNIVWNSKKIYLRGCGYLG